MAEKKKGEDAKAILDQGAQITLAGKQYVMRRVTVRDVFSFSNMVNEIMDKLSTQLSDAPSVNEAGLLFLKVFLNAPEDFAGFYAPLIGITAEEFLNLSPEALADFLEILPQQQDMKAFFPAVSRTIAAIGSLWQNV
jgi:hypothetical protein